MTPSHVVWFLEKEMADASRRHIELHRFPFQVGRATEADLQLTDASVSREHAELDLTQGGLSVRDLGSRNGTFVNRRPISTEGSLQSGDVLHFGSVVFRLRSLEVPEVDLEAPTQEFTGSLPRGLPRQSRELSELIANEAVSVCAQPIVEAVGGDHQGVELLGRGRHPDLPIAPWPLFRLAESVGLAVELSELFRRQGLRMAAAEPGVSRLFINTHPEELRDPERLFAELRAVRRDYSELGIVLEIHERAVVDQRSMAALREVLQELDFGLAYDDFGAGEARFLELVTVPPDYLKFDNTLIRGLHYQSSASRLALIESMILLAKKLGTATVAEGVATSGEAEACRSVGFDYLQGFQLGKPAALPAAGP